MRVARLIERLPPATGGKEIHAAALSRELHSQGVEQHIWCRSGDPLGPEIAHSLVRPGLASRVEPLASYCLGMVRAVSLAHRTRPFDLIHAHGDFPEAMAAASLSTRLGIPAVLTVHGGLSEVSWHNDLRLVSFSAMEAIIAVSTEIAADIREVGVSSRVFRCPSAVRDELFDLERRPQEPATIITVGRLAPVKGIQTLLAAHDLMSTDGRLVRWIVVAGGADAYADGLRSQISERPDMTCLSVSDPDDLAALLSKASVFVLPSIRLERQREGVPTALMEAIAACVPVVASDTGGIGEVVCDGDTGLLVEPGDARALAAAIEDALADPEASAIRAARARAAGGALRWRDVASETRSIYSGAIERHRQPAAMFALPWLDLGGAEYFTLSLARGFRTRGVRTAMAGAPGRLVAELGDEIEYVPLVRLRSLRAAALNAAALSGALIRLRPQAVNSHHFAIGLLSRAGSLLARVKTKQILTLHTTEDPRMIAPVGALGGFLFDKILPVSQGVQDELSRFTPRQRRDRFEVVRVGIKPAPAVEQVDRTVGVVARLVPRKGHDVLLEAWRRVAADERGVGWTLELWGEGPDRPAIERTITDLPNVRLIGSVDRAGDSIGRFPIVVLSSYREGLPLVLVEAMAAGCAVIASDLPGCRELIGDACGLLFPPGDVAELTNCLLALISDPALRDHLADAARARVADAFTRQRMIDSYVRNLFAHTPIAPHPADTPAS